MTKERNVDEKLKHAFNTQRYHAENIRNIKFLLTFNEWLEIWIQSGHLEERGSKKGQYCMSRYGDIGPYEIGNVFIQLHSINVSAANKGRPSPKKGIPRSEEIKSKISAANKGVKRGPYKKKGVEHG